MILKNHISVPVGKKRLSLSNEARRETSRNKFVDESGLPDKSLKFIEVDSTKIVRVPGLSLLNPFAMDRVR